MLRKSILIGLFVLKNNRIELKSLQRGYKRKLSPRDFFLGRHKEIGGVFRTGGLQTATRTSMR